MSYDLNRNMLTLQCMESGITKDALNLYLYRQSIHIIAKWSCYYSYTYDAYGNMTPDGANDLESHTNKLNLIIKSQPKWRDFSKICIPFKWYETLGNRCWKKWVILSMFFGIPEAKWYFVIGKRRFQWRSFCGNEQWCRATLLYLRPSGKCPGCHQFLMTEKIAKLAKKTRNMWHIGIGYA